ncbi:MAG: phage major capsid protein [Solobacterium sp.]|jgi:HK97 family phage major capsid protein|nr:phage major capsid protein [Solobacterium sp.]MCH4205293.1 phage major capsid protein [Solobacterium sp.]MCH4226886.1 phage major capsid protein [Solobacterium sp.]MCH4281646.1 phage major capsid protein [Solobacterium sp.]
MNKKMRELLAAMQKHLDAAKGLSDQSKADEAQKEMDAYNESAKAYAVEKAIYTAEANAPTDEQIEEKENKATKGQECNPWVVMAKYLSHKDLTETERKSMNWSASDDGLNAIVPTEISNKINELRKSYVQLRDIINVETTLALTGTAAVEDSTGTFTGLVEFEDGGDLDSKEAPKLKNVKWSIKHYGKLIPIGNILLGAEQVELIAYLNRWFVKNAVLTENAKIIATLKDGKTAVACTGWKALKKAMNKDLDPAVKIDGNIVTNSTGFAMLDDEEFKDGRPILQPNPTDASVKMFNGMNVFVISDAELPMIDATHAPMFVGSEKAAVTMKLYKNLEYATSDQYMFGKNSNCMRVIEGFDLVKTDDTAYEYVSFANSSTTTA